MNTTPEQPTILQRATLKDGAEVSFKYWEQDTKDNMGLQKGFVVHRIEAHIDGKEVGYLKISYLSSELLFTCFPTLWHWVSKAQGWAFDPEDLVNTWTHCHFSLGRMPPSCVGVLATPYMLTKAHAPDEKTMQAELQILEHSSRLPKAFSEWQHGILDDPFVDYIRVRESDEVDETCTPLWTHHRRGIGTLLYEAGARWIAATKGFPLRSSGIQSAAAKAAWVSMRDAGDLPIYPGIRSCGKPCLRIDYLRRGVEAAA
tara:strand:+ start:1187 stop:1960 length:774 start_codon:yes stop_codon:yes gene_type:complete